jgi:hypothetical protein
MRDLISKIDVRAAITPVVITDNTASVSAIIDRRGFDSLAFLITLGTLSDADATLTALMEEGDDSGLSDAAAVADGDLNGTEALASATFADDGECRKIGYVGNKRYVRLTLTPAANTGNIPVAAVAVLALGTRPTANPPA